MSNLEFAGTAVPPRAAVPEGLTVMSTLEFAMAAAARPELYCRV